MLFCLFINSEMKYSLGLKMGERSRGTMTEPGKQRRCLPRAVTQVEFLASNDLPTLQWC